MVAKDRTFVRQSARRTVSQKFQTLYHANQYVYYNQAIEHDKVPLDFLSKHFLEATAKITEFF